MRLPCTNPGVFQVTPTRAKFTHYYHQQTPPAKVEQNSTDDQSDKLAGDDSTVKVELKDENITVDSTDSSEVRVFLLQMICIGVDVMTTEHSV